MRKTLLYRFLWGLSLFAAVTCDKVNELSDDATIASLTIETVTPVAVIPGTPEIGTDEVIIPLVFGKYLFPIQMEVTISTGQEIDKILWHSEDKSLSFESLYDIYQIELISLSGVVHSYTFRLQEVQSLEDADIEKFEITFWSPASFLFAHTPYYNIIDGTIEIIGISDHFPLTITPHITVSEGASLSVFAMPLNITFPSYDSYSSIPVTAQSGKERLWQIKLKQAQVVPPLEAPNTDIRERISLSSPSISATLSGGDAEIKSIGVDIQTGIITLSILSADWSTTWEAMLSFSVSPYTQTVGYVPGESFTIQGTGVQKNFYLIEMLDGYASEWKVECIPWLSPAAEIESFEWLSYNSEYAFMELGVPIISGMLKTVVIPVEKGFDFPLTIDAYQFAISSDASLLAALPQKLIFYDFDTQYSVAIQAQNGEINSWTIAISDERSGSDEARVTGYTIQSYSGTSQTENNLALYPLASIDVNAKTVTFHILDWANKFPLKVSGHIDISPGATLFPFSFTADHEFVFETLNDKFNFTVVSESGDSEQTWSIVLQNNTTPKSSAKEVIDFVSGAPSGGFQFSEKYLELQKHQITLIVSERVSGSPMVLAPRITVSPNARLSGIVSGAQLSLSFDTPKQFWVQAEDESMEEWNIVLIYAPQISNSGFESWGKANNSDMNLLPANGTGWCTSNSSTMTNATRVAGYNSPYAVQVQTTLQTMNFVIFKVTTIAASTAFLGKFTLKTGVSDVYNPISMTTMGIPFPGNAAPIAFSVDYKYVRGSQLTVTEPIRGSLIPSFKAPANISGSDAASLRVELFYNPVGVFDYVSALNRKETIARGEILERNDVHNWTHAYVPIEAAPGKERILPTHIVMVLTSSHEGDSFTGAPGSTLTADNLTLIYYKPEEGAKLLP